jgi:hypothetical protein
MDHKETGAPLGLFRVFNSPRVAACGYDGPETDPDEKVDGMEEVEEEEEEEEEEA